MRLPTSILDSLARGELATAPALAVQTVGTSSTVGTPALRAALIVAAAFGSAEPVERHALSA